uniref:Uncharacterized protein n=1 Tax=Ciona intestinalis TaxID=7719 RepID=F7BE87_CIOIN
TKQKCAGHVCRHRLFRLWETHKTVKAQKLRKEQDGQVIDLEDPNHGTKDPDVVARAELIKACRAYFADTYLKNTENKIVGRCMYWGK